MGQSRAKPHPITVTTIRVLTTQGSDAPGGAYDYLGHGRMMVFAWRGALAVVLGLVTAGLQALAILFPRLTASVMVLLIGAYLLLDGAIAIERSFRAAESFGRWLGFQGALGLCVGVAVLNPLVPLPSPLLIMLIGGWAIAMGALELLLARDVRRPYWSKALMVSGVVALLFGVVTLIAWPGAGLTAFMLALAAFLLVLGVSRIVAGLGSP